MAQNNCLCFDGADDHVVIPPFANEVSQFTIETWINPNELSVSTFGIFNTNSWINGSVHFQMSKNAIELAIYGGVYSLVANYTFVNNSWYHVAATYNAGAVKIYINGILESSGTVSALSANFTDACAGAWNASRYFNGMMDNYRIWNVEHSASEINDYMVQDLTGSEPHLLLDFSFNQGIAGGNNTGLTTAANSIGTNHGTLINFALTGATSNLVERIYKAAPTNQATNFTAQMDEANIELTWTDAIGDCLPDGYLILASTTNEFNNPTNGTEPTLDADLSDGKATIKVTHGFQRYAGYTNIVDGNTYFFRIYSYTNLGSNIIFKTEGDIPQTQITKSFPQFEELAGTLFENVRLGSAEWGDYDNDEDLDLLITGVNGGGTYSKIYRNDAGVFTDINSGLTGVHYSDAAWGDYDNDGDLDILLTGRPGYGSISIIYRNDSGIFTDINAGLTGVYRSAVAWGDYDNDGFLDILLSGRLADDTPVTKIYRNNGDGTFNEQYNMLLPGVAIGDVAWGDYDNDGFLDIVLTGFASSNGITKIFRNNGNNSFTEQVNISLEGFHFSSVAWGDYDNDGFLDILLTGDYSRAKALIYRNNGSGNFIYQTDIQLKGVYGGKGVWGDFDNDGDLDILLTGNSDSGYRTIVYRNDENAFNEIDAGLIALQESTATWGDYDNDGDLDIFLSGDSGSGYISKIFKNTNNIANNPPEAPQVINYEANTAGVLVRWNRVTTDETPDGGITYNLKIGRTPNGNEYMTSHSQNNGKRKIAAMGNMQTDTTFLFQNLQWDSLYYPSVQAVDHGFEGGAFKNGNPVSVNAVQLSNLKGALVNNNSIKLTWKRGNGNKCILFAKENADTTHFPTPINKTTYYYNNTFGEGSPIGTTGWYCIYKGVSDSMLFTGLDPSKTYKVVGYEFQNNIGTEIYKSTLNTTNSVFVGSSAFSESSVNSLLNIFMGSAAWGDYDNDGDLDVLLTGWANFGPVSRIYRNDKGVFTDINAGLTGVASSSVAWGDFDNDGDLDILITGHTNPEPLTKIYRNDSVSFTDISADLPDIKIGSVSLADYDNDGDLDILLTGRDASNNKISRIYRNDYGAFTDINAGITGVEVGSVAWGDYDNDGDLDILITGLAGSGMYSKIYRNNAGAFTDINAGLVGVYNSDASWGDYDNDGDLDILLLGNGITKIYRNDSCYFTDINAGLVGINDGSAAWGDYDNDGDLDLLLTGSDQNYIPTTKLYKNNSGIFNVIDAGLTCVNYSSVAWGDYDNDGDLDILLIGSSPNEGLVSKIYNNNLFMNPDFKSNTKPTAPQGLFTIQTPGVIKLNWIPGTDNETLSSAINYNLRYKNADSANWIFAAHTIDNTTHGSGHRLMPAIGNIQYNKHYKINNLKAGKYLWQIQAIDQGYLGSNWSTIDTFEVKTLSAFFSFDTVCLRNPNTFIDHSVSTHPIVSRAWKYFNPTTENFEIVAFDSIANFVFPYSGTDSIMLVIKNSDGSTDSITNTIYVFPTPEAIINATDVCFGNPTPIFNDSDTDTLVIQSWEWTFGDSETIFYNQNPGSHQYLDSGVYEIELRIFTENGCMDSTQTLATVAEYPAAGISANGNPEFCGGDSIRLSVSYNANYLYNWKIGTASQQNSNNNIFYATETGKHTVSVINQRITPGCVTNSVDTVDVTINPIPGVPILNIEGENPFCDGSSIDLYVNGNSTLYEYNWKKTNGAQGFIAFDATRVTITDSGYYTLQVVDRQTGCSVFSEDTIQIMKIPSPTIPSVSINGSTQFCAGETITLSVDQQEGMYYQWLKDNVDISGATSPSLTVSQAGTYQLRISNDNGCAVYTQSITTGILDAPPIPNIQANNDLEFCQGDSVVLSFDEIAGCNSYWIYGADTVGVNAYSFIATQAGNYTVRLENENGCTSNADVDITVNASPNPVSISLDGDPSFCEGESVTLSVNTAGGFNYQWFKNDNAITGATGANYVANASGVYHLNIYNATETQCSYKTPSVNVASSEYPDQQSIEAEGDTLICPSESVIFNVANNPDYIYKWKHDGITLPNANSYQYTATEEGKYSVTINNLGCEITTSPREIVHKDAPPKPELLSQGPNVWVLACSNDSALNYRWYFNGELIPGATEHIYLANQILGDYYVSINNGGDCYISTDILTIPYGDMEKPGEASFGNIKIYPNPTPGVFHIEMDNQLIGKIYIRITNLKGRELFNLNFNKQTRQFHTEMNLGGQGKGIYFIEFRFEKDVAVRKVVVE